MPVQLEGQPNRVLDSAVRIMQRELQTQQTVTLRVDSKLPAEAFRIDCDGDNVQITGGDGRGVLYGCGRFLRRPQPSDVCAPGKPFRGAYFAVHMNNFYHNAPMPLVARYVEELALCGINALFVYYHMFHFHGASDPACVAFTERLNAILDAARSVGMKTGVTITPNDGYLDTPPSLGFEGDVPRNWGTEICPSKPEGLDKICRQFDQAFAALPNLDYVLIWSYDSGGCHCDKCRPWGVNGLYVVAEPLAAVFRKRHPQGKVIFSTWLFDYNCGELGEFDAFYERLAAGQLDYADLIMADGAHVNGYFPQRVLDQPPSKPVVNFMDLSMRTGCPWGSFGANPMPAFIESEWRRVEHAIEGGTPYSEGIFEDINKFIWSQLCWAPNRSVRDIVEEYAAYHLSPELSGEITDAIMKIENVGRRERFDPDDNRITLPDTSLCMDAWRIMQRVDRALPLKRRRSWRWRLLLLRALIDAELAQSDGRPTAALGRAYDELSEMYHVDEHSLWYVRPDEVVAADDQSLRFAQNGRTIAEFCPRHATLSEEAIADA